MDKRAIESVEVWMWLIAGLLIGSLIFVSGFMLLSQWVHNNEVNQATNSFSLLKSSILNVCAVGTERQEVERYVFPRIVNNITVENDTGYGSGHIFCIDIEGEPRYCEAMHKEPNSCELPIDMNIVTFDNEKGIFYVVQKAVGQEHAVKFKFTITKEYEALGQIYRISVKWKEEFIK